MSLLVQTPDERQDPRSPLMQAIDKSRIKGANPGVVNACPHGCTIEEGQYDELGYCRHLVGFTNAQLPDGPVKKEGQGTIEVLVTEKGKDGERRCVTGKTEPLRVGDYLLRLTSSRRVYRDVDADAAAEAKAKELAKRTETPPAGKPSTPTTPQKPVEPPIG